MRLVMEAPSSAHPAFLIAVPGDVPSMAAWTSDISRYVAYWHKINYRLYRAPQGSMSAKGRERFYANKIFSCFIRRDSEKFAGSGSVHPPFERVDAVQVMLPAS